MYMVMTHAYPNQLQCQSSAGDRGPVAGVGGRVGKSGKSGVSHGIRVRAILCMLV